MSRRRRLVISLACAVAVALLFLMHGQSVRRAVEEEQAQAIRRYGGEVTRLAVTTRRIEAGETLRAADVAERDWISTLAPEGALTSIEEVVGRMVTVPVAKGSPLTALNFREDQEMLEVPAGKVAVTVPLTDKLGVASGISVGSRLVAYEATEDGVILICQGATVLAAPGQSSVSSWNASLTIAVDAGDVARVLEASAAGDLRLVVPADDVELGGAQPTGAQDVEPVEHQDAAGQPMQQEAQDGPPVRQDDQPSQQGTTERDQVTNVVPEEEER